MKRLLTFSAILTILFSACKKDTDKIPNDPVPVLDNDLISGGSPASFERVIGGIKSDGLISVKQTIDGGYIFCGYTENLSASERDIMVLKTNNLGETDWIKTYPGNFNDYGWYIEPSDDNGFVIAASVALSANTTFSIPTEGEILKINSSGNLLWRKSFSFGNKTSFSMIRQTNDGGYIVCGNEFSANEGILLKTDANGNELWRRKFASKKKFNHIDLTSDGGFILCGTNEDASAQQIDIFLVRTDNNGDTLWTRTLGDFRNNIATAIIELGNGFVVCGYHASAPDIFGFLSGLDSGGNETWTKEYQTSDLEEMNYLNVTYDNEFIALGREKFESQTKVYLLKINSADGDIIWKKSFNAGGINYLSEVQQTSDHGFIIAGHVLKSGNGNGYIIKTDENGD